jgi:hypothetical protein
MTQASWSDVQRRASVQGSPILTNWKAERERQRVTNAVTYDGSVYEAFGITPGASGIVVSPVSAKRVAAVRACRQKIAGSISTLRAGHAADRR